MLEQLPEIDDPLTGEIIDHLKTARAALAYVPFKEAAINAAMNTAAFHIDEAMELLRPAPAGREGEETRTTDRET